MATERLEDPAPAKGIRFDTAQPPRISNALILGKDNYSVDREAVAEIAKVDPTISFRARQCRAMSARVVRFLAGEAGVRQFLDLGAGLPYEVNPHEVAQSIAPESKVIHVDNDPVVLAHARALLTSLTPEGMTACIDGDVREPGTIIAEARELLDFSQPIAVLLFAVLGHAAHDYATMRSITDQLVAAIPSGSYLAMLDGAKTDDEAFLGAVARGAEVGHLYYLRTPQQMADSFEGLDLVEPGMVPVDQWRPDPVDIVDEVSPSSIYGGVGRKP